MFTFCTVALDLKAYALKSLSMLLQHRIWRRHIYIDLSQQTMGSNYARTIDDTHWTQAQNNRDSSRLRWLHLYWHAINTRHINSTKETSSKCINLSRLVCNIRPIIIINVPSGYTSFRDFIRATGFHTNIIILAKMRSYDSFSYSKLTMRLHLVC